MAIVWYSNRDGQSYSCRRNDEHSFQEHNERMRAFRLAHPKNWKQWGQNTSEVQGSLLALAPIREVVLVRYWQN